MHRAISAGSRSQWNAERLRLLFAAFDGCDTVVLANREPFQHDLAPDGRVVVHHSSGGLVTALEPLMEACAGVWVAHGSGTADRLVVDEQDRLAVPPANPTYRLRRVWLDDRERRGYYYGFANEGLWPLCHRAHVQPVFRSDDFAMYQRVNGRFANAVCTEVNDNSPLIFVQDYHFALAPRLIRRRLPLSCIVAFWHIPWPHPRDYAILPWRRQLLEGLLGATILGLQTPEDCRHFVETVRLLPGARVNLARDVVTYAGTQTTVRAYPISIEWPSRWADRAPSTDACRTAVCSEIGAPSDVLLGIGVDRLDYTKGINEKFLAVEQLLERRPELRERFVFVQIAEPSRHCLAAYREVRRRIVETADRINRRFSAGRYRPIILIEAHREPADVYRFLRAADLCYVGSLHDGMNLVAKEFVSAREDCRGVLILSEFAGAARELTSALIVNPYAIDRCAQALAQALVMPEAQQAERMIAMRSVVARHNVYRWAGEILTDAARLRKVKTGGRELLPASPARLDDHVGQADF